MRAKTLVRSYSISDARQSEGAIYLGDLKAAVLAPRFVRIVAERQRRRLLALSDVPVGKAGIAAPRCGIRQPGVFGEACPLQVVTDGARAVHPDAVLRRPSRRCPQAGGDAAEIRVHGSSDVRVLGIEIDGEIDRASGRLANS